MEKSVTMSEVANKLIVCYEYKSNKEEYRSILNFALTLFSENKEEFQDLLEKRFKEAGY